MATQGHNSRMRVRPRNCQQWRNQPPKRAAVAATATTTTAALAVAAHPKKTTPRKYSIHLQLHQGKGSIKHTPPSG